MGIFGFIYEMIKVYFINGKSGSNYFSHLENHCHSDILGFIYEIIKVYFINRNGKNNDFSHLEHNCHSGILDVIYEMIKIYFIKIKVITLATWTTIVIMTCSTTADVRH